MPVRIPTDISTFPHARRALKVLVACTTLAIAGPAAVAQAAASSTAASGTTVHFPGLPQVGALFGSPDYTGASAAHFCTGTVIDSPAGDLVLTAAHCVYDASTGTYTHASITFAPGYDNGLNTHLGGAWTVTSIDVPDGYKTSGNTEDDYALLVIAPQYGLNIEQVTGGLRVAATHLPEQVAVVGYNDLVYDAAGNEPIICSTKAFEETDGGEPWSRFDCPNYQDGTSGGPWITRGGEVVGVIGGYEQGGDSPDWSYSAIFDRNTLAFVHSAGASN
ncbi:MAG TPA: trypsin-like peptidase domain-containing protein [Actinospica sp.]|nr:trypsin-like peptidase domain-containing protein [Actinospica sp.]